GVPNGYVLGQEASGAFIGGLRYGDGTLYTRNAGDVRVFWQGPSVGFDAGADGARTMMLVYNLPQVGAIFDRFGGINGSAYFIGGFGMTALTQLAAVEPQQNQGSATWVLAGRNRSLCPLSSRRNRMSMMLQYYSTTTARHPD